MIVEGVSVAIVALGLEVSGLVHIVDIALSDPPNEPAASDESEPAFGMQPGDELHELAPKNEGGVPERLYEPAVSLAPRVPTYSVAQGVDQHVNSGGNLAYSEECLETIRQSGVTELDDLRATTRGGHYFSSVHIATTVNPAPTSRRYQQQDNPQPRLMVGQVFGSSARAGSRFV